MTTSLRVVIGLLGASLFALAVTGSPIYARLSYLWAILLLASWLWSKLILRDFNFERKATVRRAAMGQIFMERFEIRNNSRFPWLWLEIRDDSTLPGSQGSMVLALISGRQGRSYLARTRLVQRGMYPLGPTMLASGDPFGLFPVRRRIEPIEKLLVYPLMVEIRVFPNPPGLLSGGEALRRRTPEATTNAAGVRDYQSGDPLNRIHWLTTARRERLMVKEFELDPLAEVWILLDAERVVQASRPYSIPGLLEDGLWQARPEFGLPPSTEEYAAAIGASIAKYYITQGRAVGFVASGQTYNLIPPDRGSRQLNKILEMLAVLRARGAMDLSSLVTAQSQHLVRGSTVVLITPSVRKDIPITIDYLLRRGQQPVVVLIDNQSFGGPSGSRRTEAAIRGFGVPVRRIAKDDDLDVALNHVTLL